MQRRRLIAGFLALSGAAAACNGPGPVIGGPCEYAHYAGECSFVGLDAKPNDSDPDLLWVTIRHQTLGQPLLMLSEQVRLPRWELEELRAHYREQAQVKCEVSQIKTGTCAPGSAAYERRAFITPGSAGLEKPPCAALEQCAAECSEKQSDAACDRAGYLLRYGVGVPADRVASDVHYRATLKRALADCKGGFGRACLDLANRAERGFGTDPDPKLATELYGVACKLGERGGCRAATVVE